MTIPCGQCIGCRLDRKRSWALRLTHEARSHCDSIFLTLTYSDDHLPRGGTLVKRHCQLFMKRLRKKLAPALIRYFLVGEYGDKGNRPHYHALIFGWWPADAKCEATKGGNRYYSSATIAALWPDGLHNFSTVTPATCKYVSHYVVKKVGGDMAKEYYTRLTLDGELVEVIPEFSLMSKGRKKGDGIGARTFRKFQSDYTSEDLCLLEGKKVKMPAYYDKLIQMDSELQLEAIKAKRKQNARKHRANNTPERLAARETVAKAKLNFNNGRKAEF